MIENEIHYRDAEVIGDELSRESRAVVKEAHELLNGPDGDGQFNGSYETMLFSFRVAKGLALAAFYAATKEEGQPDDWTALRKDFENGGLYARKLLADRLSLMLWNGLQYELHLLAMGSHPALLREAKRRGYIKDEPGSEPGDDADSPFHITDDDVPF